MATNPLASLFKGFSGSSKIYGKKYIVPDLPDLETAQKAAVSANIATLPQAQQLTSSVNLFNQEELARMRERQLPGAQAEIESILRDMRQGKLTSFELENLRRSNAERGIDRGVGGGFQLGAGLLGELGASMQRTQEGLQSTEQWFQMSQAPAFDVTSMFIKPLDKYTDFGNQWGVEKAKRAMAAAPDPGERGTFDSTMALIGMVLSAYGGGSGYQGTYNARQQQQGPLYGPQEASAGGANSFYIGGGGYGFGKQSGGSWFTGSRPGSG